MWVQRLLREGVSIGFSEIAERLTAEVLLGCFEERLLAVKRESESVVWWGFEKGSQRGVSAGFKRGLERVLRERVKSGGARR